MIDIEYLDSLPKRESISQGIVRRYGSLYGAAKWEGYRHREKYKYPWRIAYDVLKKYIGQSYDDAYSEYCRKLKEYGLKDPDNKRHFDESISELCFWRINRHYTKNYEIFSVDDNKIIHWDMNYFEQLSSYSRRRFPQTLPVLNGYYEITEFRLLPYVSNYGLKSKISLQEYLNLSDYYQRRYEVNKELREYITFDSKNDRSYKRYKQEERKFHKKLDRQKEKEKKEIQYSFLTKDEQRRIKERETDLIKRDSHGFDDESFKGEHYHGQKRKNKETIEAFKSF